MMVQDAGSGRGTWDFMVVRSATKWGLPADDSQTSELVLSPNILEDVFPTYLILVRHARSRRGGASGQLNVDRIVRISP
jgi:hypothetical protein